MADLADFEEDEFAAPTSSNSEFNEFLDEPAAVAPVSYNSPAFSTSNQGSPSVVRESPVFASSPSFGVTHDSGFNIPAEHSFAESPLSVYRREHEDYLEQKDRNSESARRELLTKASGAIDEFNHTRSEKRDKQLAKNREDEKKFVRERDAILEGGNYANDWERVGALIDFKAPAIGRDTSRLRKLLIELKH